MPGVELAALWIADLDPGAEVGDTIATVGHKGIHFP